MSLLSNLQTIAEHCGVPVETGVFSGKAPDTYLVITPLSDSFEFHPHSQPQGQGASQGAAHGGCGGASDHAPRPRRIQNRYYGSSLQGHQAECGKRERLKKRTSRVTVSDAELFTRLLYYGLAHLHLSQDEVWLMPFGLLLDLWECHKQYNGQAVPAHEHYIDDIIPDGI